MRCHLYNAAGNRILWIDGGESVADFKQLKVAGATWVRQCRFDQEMTAIIFAAPSGLRALFWNPDGSEEDLCGNALRCLPHFVSNDTFPIDDIAIETPSGRFLGRATHANHGLLALPADAIAIAAKMPNGDVLVDVGTPHRIRVVQTEWPAADVDDAIALSSGSDPVNVDLVRKISPCHFRARIFERGVGETHSCGTGAVAIVAALGSFGANGHRHDHAHLVEFASREHLMVSYDWRLNSFEVSGTIDLLMKTSVAMAQ